MSGNTPFYPVDDPGQAQVKPWAIDSQHLRSTILDLSVARDNYELKISGDFLWIASSTFGAAQISVNLRQDAVGLPGIVLKRGSSIAGVKYDSVFISNVSQQGVITIVYGQEIGNNIRIDNYIDDGISYIDDTYYTLNKSAFGRYFRFTPDAVKYAHVSFQNITTGETKVIITSCQVKVATDDVLITGSAGLYTGAMTTSDTVGLLNGLGALTNRVRTANGSEASPEIAATANNFSWTSNAREFYQVIKKHPITLDPNYAIAFCANTADITLETVIEGYLL